MKINLRKLFAPLAIFAMALGLSTTVGTREPVISVEAATTTTTVTFAKASIDSTAAFTTATITTAANGLKDSVNGSFISSTTAIDKVYAGTKGFKYGSSSVVGTWTFNTSKVVTKIVIVFDKYGTDASTTGKVTSLDDSKNATSSVISGPTTLTLDNISSDSFTIEAQVKRLYLTSIEFTHEAEGGSIPVTGVSVSPESLNLVAGGATGQLSATVSPEDATDKTGVFSSNNTAVATVSSMGVVTPLKQGTATVTFTTNNGGFSDTATINVSYATLTSISLNKSSSSIIVGETEAFTVTANPTTASNLVTWLSSNELVATVSSGTVTAVAVGTATITATSTQDATKTATVEITVLPVPVYSRFTKITSASQLYFGATYIIANADGSFAMSKTASGNNIPQVATTLESGKIVDNSNIMKIALEIGTVKDSYALKSISSDSIYDGLYLHAASSSSNYLRLKATKDSDASWKITFSDGVPLIVAQGSYTRETMQYNSGSSLFSAYDTASQAPVALFLDESSVDHSVAASMYASEVNTGLGNTAATTCQAIYELLGSVYNRLSTEAKNTVDTSTDAAFVNARARMAYLAAWVAQQGGGSGLQPDIIAQTPKTNSTFGSILLIALIGFTSVAGYYVLKRKSQLG